MELNKYKTTCLIIFSFSLPFAQNVSTYLIILWFALSLTSFRQFKLERGSIIIILFYLLYYISDIINGFNGLDVLEKKASFVILPLIFAFNKYSIKSINKAYISFVYGCLAAVVYCNVFAIYNSFYFSNGILVFNPNATHAITNSFIQSSIYGGNYFFGGYYSLFHQTVFFATFINIALVLVLFNNLFNPKLKTILSIVFIISIFQISNRINLFIACIILLIFIIQKAKRFHKSKFVVSLGLMAVLVLGFVNPRSNEFIKNIVKEGIVLDREADDSFNLRLLTWDASISLILREKFLGVGSTDAYNALKEIYKSKRYVTPFRERLNSHNQYLQITIETGFLGLLLLISSLIIICLLPFSTLKTNQVPVFFVGIISINFLFESFLNRYSGIIIFVYFFMIFITARNRTFIKKK